MRTYYLTNQTGGTSTPPDHVDEEYTRPSEWPTLSTPTGSMFIGLHLVSNSSSNLVTIRCTTTASTFNVNWGNGVTTSHASNTTAERNLAWADYAGTDTAAGYRLAVITVTPTSGTANFTVINTSLRHSTFNQQYQTGWLEMKASGTAVTSFVLSSGVNVLHSNLQIFEYTGTNAITDFSSFARNTTSLRKFSMYTGAGTNFASMFFSSGLWVAPDLNLSSASNASCFNNMFDSMPNLKRAVVNFQNKARPLTQTFNNCRVLKTLTLSGTGNITGISGMCTNDTSLEEPPTITSTGILDASNAYSGCSALCVPPTHTLTSATNVAGYLQNCLGLACEELTFNIPAATNVGIIISGAAVKKLTFVMGLNATPTQVYTSVMGLREVYGLKFVNVAGTITANNSTTPSLTKMEITVGTGQSIIMTNAMMGATELNAVYTSLPDLTGLTSRNINVTSCVGASASTKSIATAKNWTVTG